MRISLIDMKLGNLLPSWLLLILLACMSKNFVFTRLQIVQGGGFTGMYYGYIIQSDGKVFKCEGKETCDSVNIFKTLTPKEIRDLNEIIVQYKLLELDYQSPHNISRKMILNFGSSTKIFIWNPFSKDSIEEKLSEIYEKIESFVK